MNKLTYVVIGALVAGAAVATGIGYYSYNGQEDASYEEQFEDVMESDFEDLNLEEAALPADGQALSSNSRILVENQPPGLSVHIASLMLTRDQWVVIHEDKNGSPGAILGAGRFRAGMTSGDVELLRATEEGRTYYAMFHRDDGVTGFDPKSDLPSSDDAGHAIMSSFMAKTVINIQVQ